MTKNSRIRPLFLALALTLLAGCGSSSSIDAPLAPAPLSAGNINLIFVLSPDLAYSAPGDVSPSTANLTNQGLQRSLLMATYLKQQVLGTKNVTGIYALEPMSHLQTPNKYPDMAAIGAIQQFALLNQSTLASNGPGSPYYTGNSYAINVSYGPGATPIGAATPTPEMPCPGCQGLDFNDTNGNNETLVANIIRSNVPGFYVFSAPWETASDLLGKINKLYGNALPIPSSYSGPDQVYAVSVTPGGIASLVTYNSKLNPPSSYPTLSSSALVSTSCTAQVPFSILATRGINGAVIPAGTNTNATIHMIRHVEAHPLGNWENGNYVAAGQWRALALPNALRGKINPGVVYSSDPAQIIPSVWSNTDWGAASGSLNWSYVRPVLTVEPYAIANNLPFYLFSGAEIFDPTTPPITSNFFFTSGKFSNQTVLMAWEHDNLAQVVTALVSSYFPAGGPTVPTVPVWPDADYDTIWTAKFDASGNLTLSNALCEGIDSSQLPVTAPQF